MKKSLIVLFLTLIICVTAIPLSASASGFYGYDNMTAEMLCNEINTNEYWGIKGGAELDKSTKTVKLLKDLDKCRSDGWLDLWINNLAENIILDLNGHTIYDSYISINDDNFNSFTFKDSTGGGKIIGDGGPCSAVETFGGVKLIFESGTYIGGNATEYIHNEDVAWIDSATSALAMATSDEIGKECSVVINGGTFIGGSGLNRTDLDKSFIEHSDSAIRVSYEYADTNTEISLKISEKAVIKGGIGGNGVNGGHGLAFYNTTANKVIEITNAEITGGDGTVGGDAIYSDSVLNFKLTDTVLKGGKTGGKAVNVPKNSKVEIITTPKPITASKNGVTVNAASGVFENDTVIEITKLTNGSPYQKANTALSKTTKSFALFDITAKLNGSAVQPNGQVTVSFDIPKDYDISQTEVYYIAENGAAQKLDSKINNQNRTATVTLKHFSLYAVTQKKVDSSSDKTTSAVSGGSVSSTANGKNSQTSNTSSSAVSAENNTKTSEKTNSSEKVNSSPNKTASAVHDSSLSSDSTEENSQAPDTSSSAVSAENSTQASEETNLSESENDSVEDSSNNREPIAIYVLIAVLVLLLLGIGAFFLIKNKNRK